ncbi:hypothetical protein B0A48_06503 [Cryoendolithus antarcticus]|uniref:Cytidyltransferase-like domain-containing protein n=1 Tax=Cryoendolithus antarcticus TaxID=1507870 RepID=A0A1V8TB48_9PEZI|nr:hypothetical protein B0A48_06503 [Cryoendolithus antarcticus]
MADDSPSRFLLLLPSAPSPPSLQELKKSFGDTVLQVLQEVATASPESSKAAILEIAIACPSLANPGPAPRGQLYNETQPNLAAVYKLVCIIAAANDINVEDSDGVDVRVLLLAWSPDSVTTASTFGPVVTLETLAHADRAWQYAFGDESAAGEALVKAFVAAKGSNESISRLQSGAASQATSYPDVGTAKPSTTGPSSTVRDKRHHDVAVGGTFDHLHIGHKLLLTMTLFLPEKRLEERPATAIVGITGDQLLVNKKHASVLESWQDRQRAIEDFCDSIIDFELKDAPKSKQVTKQNDPGPNGKAVNLHYPAGLVVKCTEIQDPFGPTITEESISALIISAETRSGGKAVNDKRKEKGWHELEVFEVDVLDADEGGAVKEGFESKLSSTAIREKLARKQGAKV